MGLDGSMMRLRGDFHCHTTWSDGGDSLTDMVLAAEALGHEYVAITDHSPRLTVAHGLTTDRLREQWRDIAHLDLSSSVRVLRGIEVDILADGSLDQSSAVLAELDIVVASVHSGLRDDATTMTNRLVAALANPWTTVLGHCTGRKLGGPRGARPPSRFDAEVVFEAARSFGVAVEINSRPDRSDPPSGLLRLASDMGCVFAINSDAHSVEQLTVQASGVERALAAGIDASRVVNCWPLEQVISWRDESRVDGLW